MTTAGAPTPPASASVSPVLAARDVRKRFGGVVALGGVDFEARAGEIHALCGENGAGKSTMIKILGGIHPAGSYEGRVEVDGQPAAFTSVRDATSAGIAVIHQELAMVEEMTVAENVFLGDEPRRAGLLVDHEAMAAQTAALLARFPVPIDPGARVGDLGVGQRQLVEIVKALRRDCRVLVLDEPTAALPDTEARALSAMLRDLRARGIACVYISHRLDEVFALCDRITVLRDGRTVGSWPTSETTPSGVVSAMVGREIRDLYPRRASAPGKTLLRVSDLSVAPRRGAPPALAHVSFEARAGEVLGIGGLMGAGRSELLLHLLGAWGERTDGTVELDGQTLPPGAGPAAALARGLALVSEDRKRLGLLMSESVGFNLVLSDLPRLVRGGLLDDGAIFRRGRQVFEALGVKAPHLDAPVAGLSGGNQQKVVLGRALMTEPKVVLLDEPTRGVDVGARVEVYEIINRLTAAGQAVVMVSSDLPELLGMCDRIVVLRQGRAADSFARAEATPERFAAAAFPTVAA